MEKKTDQLKGENNMLNYYEPMSSYSMLERNAIETLNLIQDNKTLKKELLETSLNAARYKAMFYNKTDLVEKLDRVVNNNITVNIERNRGWCSNNDYMLISDLHLTEEEKEFCKEFIKSQMYL